MKRLAILGSTGSIGVQALDVVARSGGRFEVAALAAGSNADLLVEQARRWRPRAVALADPAAARRARELLGPGGPEVLEGAAGVTALASLGEVDVVLAAISGGAGLASTAAAIEAGKTVGLANKESMVLAGELLMRRAAEKGVAILPVDSEHSAIFQSLAGHQRPHVRRLLLTASGGPLRTVPAAELAAVTPARALKHPNWSMGAKITIDSATLMNKGLEVIEARWLFDVDPRRIDIVVHPESIVHSMVEYVDGSVVAQLGVSDMRGPISYALAWPERIPLELPALDLPRLGKLTFEAPDPARFPAFMLAYRALELGGTAPAALSGADEAAVAAFLAGRCSFTRIAEVCAEVLEALAPEPVGSVEQALAASDWGRRQAERRVAG
ncbi:1-deoxy-D-xylulose-5-phosphate reductoisomerase [Anaeromyxobacter diazotrophicus]|uniref:1-deoxy-D-xylulose 5-phosphate reductoisomerase n=1 Tax=Anaeromyxobacter diazotrophicus TaxID=2590199 RepID=A0A7I9VHA9_9BACT|nr:1-deoxy-D-xylulose-5-phosphate reductoisomerase [Anaeromyxobacter diazotrophicus]GEJ55520.1 1-deoxy-D-xylulose 5-phosphate reductoisomerase [Anaeromyxobacter diazotrophicus]